MPPKTSRRGARRDRGAAGGEALDVLASAAAVSSKTGPNSRKRPALADLSNSPSQKKAGTPAIDSAEREELEKLRDAHPQLKRELRELRKDFAELQKSVGADAGAAAVDNMLTTDEGKKELAKRLARLMARYGAHFMV